MSKQQKSQTNNFQTNLMYIRQMCTLAQNVLVFKNLPKFLDVAYINEKLLRNGAIAFFWDDVLEELLALPYTNLGTLDVYGRPTKIQVMGLNGYTRTLNYGEFVIMYDNYGQYPLFLDILQYAKRLSILVRIRDINIEQQRNPRVWQTSQDKKLSLKKFLDELDSGVEHIETYDGLGIDDLQVLLNEVTFKGLELTDLIDKIWNEFLRLIGIANLSIQKKERNIKDEIFAMQGGTIASRYNRFEPRKKAVEEINEKWGHLLKENIEVEFFDGLPTTMLKPDFLNSETEDNTVGGDNFVE